MKARVISTLLLALIIAPASYAQTPGKTPNPPAAAPVHKSPPAKTKKAQPAAKGKYFEARVDLPLGSAHSADTIVALMGKPEPFNLEKSSDAKSIYIYCQTTDVTKCDAGVLKELQDNILVLANDTSFEVIHLEHAQTVTDVVTKAQALKYPGITVAAVGTDSVKVSRTTAVSNEEYAGFMSDLRQLSWGFHPQASASRVYYLTADAAATALGASSGASGDKSGGSGSGGSNATVTVQNIAASNAGPCPAPAKSNSKNSNPKKSAASSDSAGSDGSGDDSSGSASQDAANSATGCPPAASQDPPTSGGSKDKSATKNDVSVTAVNGDVMVFTDGAPGDDAAVAERKRVLALIDFPRPEVLINTFSFQESASDVKPIAKGDQALQTAIGNYNDAFQLAMFRAWSYVTQQVETGVFFDQPLYDYLTKRYVANSLEYPSKGGDTLISRLELPLGQRNRLNVCPADRYCLGYTSLFHPLRPFLTDMLLAVTSSKNPGYQFRASIEAMQGYPYGEAPPFKNHESENNKAQEHPACGSGGPCELPTDWKSMSCDQKDVEVWNRAGENELTPPPASGAQTKLTTTPATDLNARLTQEWNAAFPAIAGPLSKSQTTGSSTQTILIEQQQAVVQQLNGLWQLYIHNETNPASGHKVTVQTLIDQLEGLKGLVDPDEQKRIGELQGKLQPLAKEEESPSQLSSQSSIAREITQKTQEKPNKTTLVFPMYCFREAIEASFPVAVDGVGYSSNDLGKPLRSALVNFLFQYKMAQQYPHEFSGFELSQSAQDLNSQLNPLIVAFNQDLAAALVPIKEVAQCNPPRNGMFGWAGHGTKFVNNGIITVRTVSGKETVVDTTTQSFFDVTQAPSITDVINSVGDAEKNVPTVLKTNLTANQAAVIIGALNSVQPTTSQVGRQFKIDVTPHSLSGASSAELDVKLLTADAAPPTRYSGGKSSNDNISRISNNTVDTKVRLESIKLFEISSFTATVQQSRHNLPLLPPFVEIPYIGSFLSLPVPGAKEFHRSTAIMSAVVVPTAADLASGVVFSKDLVLMPPLPMMPGSDICIGPQLTETAKSDDSGEEHKAAPVMTSQPCNAANALSLSDFHGVSFSEFNRKMARCFATPDTADNACSSITFYDLLPGRL